MNDYNDVTQTGSAATPAGFCQNCGKPLTDETKRVVGTAVFCEPCLVARVGGPATAGAGYGPVNAGPAAWAASVPPAGPNPGLAALLGFIPGVGAMYNEQYAKGIVHLVVFAVLVTFANSVNGIFGIFIAGWEFYMAIEAHHTAKARLEGTPLPNPFGLNDVGERLGFGKAWPAGPGPAVVAEDAARAAGGGFAGAPVPPPPAAPWGAPVDSAQSFAQEQTLRAYEQVRQDVWGGQAPGYQQTPYVAAYPMPQVPFVERPNRFPAGAAWLIGLGVFFLLATTRIFDGFRPEAGVGFGLIGLSVWLFLRRMMETGTSLAADGTPMYAMRLVRASRWSSWIALTGVLLLLETFHLVLLEHSWPLYLILGGVMLLLNRVAGPGPYVGVPPVEPGVPVEPPV